jgi:hypothetical protein
LSYRSSSSLANRRCTMLTNALFSAPLNFNQLDRAGRKGRRGRRGEEATTFDGLANPLRAILPDPFAKPTVPDAKPCWTQRPRHLRLRSWRSRHRRHAERVQEIPCIMQSLARAFLRVGLPSTPTVSLHAYSSTESLVLVAAPLALRRSNAIRVWRRQRASVALFVTRPCVWRKSSRV